MKSSSVIKTGDLRRLHQKLSRTKQARSDDQHAERIGEGQKAATFCASSGFR